MYQGVRRRLENLHRHRLCSMSALRGVLRGSRGLPGGRRELSGGSSEKLSGPKCTEKGAFENDFALPARGSVLETTRVLGEIDLSCPISSFRVYDPSFRVANDEPWFENTSNSCVATVLSSFAISLLGGRRMWPQASPIRRPPGLACGGWSKQGGRKLRKQYRGGVGLGVPGGGGPSPCTAGMHGILDMDDV